jgi:hypothetical protein
MTSRHLLNWLQFSNSNYDKPHLTRLQLRLQRSLNAHALPNHQIQSALPCPYRDKRDHRQQFKHNTSPTRHYLRGWSHLGRSTHHLRGCPLALSDSLPASCPKTTSAEWTQHTWPSPSGKTIGLGSTKQTPSSTPSQEKKWNTWHLRRIPDYNHFGHEDLVTSADASSKAFGTSLAPTHASSSNSLTSRRTERSLTAK